MSMKLARPFGDEAFSDDCAQSGERPASIVRERGRDGATRLSELVSRVSTRWRLTERQRHVLELLARGSANKQVATCLGISERTVEIHIHNIARRAGLQGRCELLAALLRDALERG